jgi:hypothetical protein
VPTEPKTIRPWPVLLLAAPAFVAIWSGWVGLGGLCGFGPVHPLPGIWDEVAINSAITLPIGMETYAAFALRVWLSGRAPEPARVFARKSSIGALALGALGQVAYHLMVAAGVKAAPTPVVIAVSCLPVAVLGMGAALAHLLRSGQDTEPIVEVTVSTSPGPVTAPDTEVDTAPPVKRTRRAPAKRTPKATAKVDSAAAITAARVQYPDWTHAALAKHVGVSTRTVSRHLAAVDTAPVNGTPVTTGQEN